MKPIAIAALTAAGIASRASALDIVIDAGSGLSANAPALAAWERAAERWESVFSDDITVTVSADVRNLGSSTIIGQAASVFLFGDTFAEIRNQMVVDASDEPSNAIVSHLPTFAQFDYWVVGGHDFTVVDSMSATKANLKAMGFNGLDNTFGASDGTIEFNSTFAFDYDRSDGITPGTVDFEYVAAHEMGHTLGFVSVVDEIDYHMETGLGSTDVAVTPLDMFRFQNRGSGIYDLSNFDPQNEAEFTAFPRMLLPGGVYYPAPNTPAVAPGAPIIFDGLESEYLFSNGAFNGDGSQASHWKADEVTGLQIGIMDPTYGPNTNYISPADIRALDLIGWDVASIPEPASLGLLAVGTFGLIRRRRSI